MSRCTMWKGWVLLVAVELSWTRESDARAEKEFESRLRFYRIGLANHLERRSGAAEGRRRLWEAK
jgi:hypothetical protein